MRRYGDPSKKTSINALNVTEMQADISFCYIICFASQMFVLYSDVALFSTVLIICLLNLLSCISLPQCRSVFLVTNAGKGRQGGAGMREERQGGAESSRVRQSGAGEGE